MMKSDGEVCSRLTVLVSESEGTWPFKILKETCNILNISSLFYSRVTNVKKPCY